MKPIRYAYLETTNHCNLSCSFCNREEVIGPLRHMSLENWKILLDKIKHHPIKEAKLMGMGEPFMHPQFSSITKSFKETFPDAFLIVATNCQYKITQNFREAIKNIDMLYLSIDGYERNYERDRSPAKWSRLLSFLQQLDTVDRGSCKVVINYVVNTQNVDDIEKVKQLGEKHGIKEIRLNMAQDWSPDESIKKDDRTWGYSNEQIQILKTKWKPFIKGKAGWDFDQCFWVKDALYTTVEGNVKVCCLNTAADPFGNLFENDIDAIRNTNRYQEVKKGCETNKPSEHCKNCSYKELSPLLQELGVNPSVSTHASEN